MEGPCEDLEEMRRRPTPGLLAEVTACVARVLEVSPAAIGADEDLEAVWGIDSLLKLEIVDELEAAVGRRFDDSLYEGCSSIRDIAGAIGAADGL